MERKETEALLKPYTHYIALGPFVWGRGKTILEAVKNAHGHTGYEYQWWAKKAWAHYTVYMVTEDTEVNGMGGLSYPIINAPIKLAYGREIEPRKEDDPIIDP